jgi:uncharacterized membrane protein
MITRWLWPYLTVLVVAAYLADLAWYYPQLPQRVPLHFNWAGLPDNWGTKQELLLWSLGTLALVVAVLAVAVVGTRYWPRHFVRFPRRDYWLAPERVEATREMLTDRIGWFSCATILLLTALLHSSLHAAFRQPPKMVVPLVTLIVYLAFVAIWQAEFWWRFRRRPE